MSLSSSINNQILYLVIQHDKQIKYILNNAFNGVNINLNNNDRNDLLEVNVNSDNVNDYVYKAIQNNSHDLVKIDLNNDKIDRYINKPINLNIDNDENGNNDIYQVNINSNTNVEQITEIEEDIDILESSVSNVKNKVETLNKELDEVQDDIDNLDLITDALYFA